jgi:NDP-sugar pyrophosphorylase family protein
VVKFEPSSGLAPQFVGNTGNLQPALLAEFPARFVGGVIFHARVHAVIHHLGKHNAYRGDQGQPLTFDSFPTTGAAVTIHSPIQGQLEIGQNVQIGGGAVILSGPLTNSTDKVSVGDNAQIGSGAVIARSTIGANSVIGARSYIAGSTIAANTTIAPGSIIINNVFMGGVEW